MVVWSGGGALNRYQILGMDIFRIGIISQVSRLDSQKSPLAKKIFVIESKIVRKANLTIEIYQN
jgi:hypothetical protein